MKRLWYVVGGGVILCVLAFAYYAISPLFISVQLEEAAPSGSVAETSTAAPVSGTPAHPASGEVRIVESDGTRFVRYENYKTINGPDLYVYLAKDLDASEFIDLGRIRATEGSVNYEIPEGIDLAQYPYVLTWCKAFGVLFNYARVQS